MKKCLLVLFFVISSTYKVQAEDLSKTKMLFEKNQLVVQKGTPVVAYKDLPSDISEYNYLDPQRIVPTEPLTQAVRYFKKFKSNIANQSYITVIDMTQHSSKKRMYVINMKTGSVSTFLTAHGKNSDRDNNGYADAFSNQDGSLMTSLGFYLTGVTYSGSHGLSLRLHGLESTNSNAYSRAIVMHGADYVNPGYVGRSFGCPAIENKYVNTLIPALKNKSLLYIYKKIS